MIQTAKGGGKFPTMYKFSCVHFEKDNVFIWYSCIFIFNRLHLKRIGLFTDSMNIQRVTKTNSVLYLMNLNPSVFCLL